MPEIHKITRMLKKPLKFTKISHTAVIKKARFMSYGVNISYWELKQYFTNVDLIVIGSGIVGLNTAIYFKKNNA